MSPRTAVRRDAASSRAAHVDPVYSAPVPSSSFDVSSRATSRSESTCASVRASLARTCATNAVSPSRPAPYTLALGESHTERFTTLVTSFEECERLAHAGGGGEHHGLAPLHGERRVEAGDEPLPVFPVPFALLQYAAAPLHSVQPNGEFHVSLFVTGGAIRSGVGSAAPPLLFEAYWIR